MTERKPPELSFTSWIDRQISEAEQRGVFDNLPGTGKPLPRRDKADHTQAWLRDKLRREGVPAEEMLPTPLKLRRQTERLAASLPGFRSEDEVRDTVAELNRQIIDWRRNSAGPPIFVPLVKEEEVVSRWRDGRSAERPAPCPAGRATAGAAPERRGWWRRLRRTGRR
jgi:hypothetical protein